MFAKNMLKYYDLYFFSSLQTIQEFRLEHSLYPFSLHELYLKKSYINQQGFFHRLINHKCYPLIFIFCSFSLLSIQLPAAYFTTVYHNWIDVWLYWSAIQTQNIFDIQSMNKCQLDFIWRHKHDARFSVVYYPGAVFCLPEQEKAFT